MRKHPDHGGQGGPLHLPGEDAASYVRMQAESHGISQIGDQPKGGGKSFTSPARSRGYHGSSIPRGVTPRSPEVVGRRRPRVHFKEVVETLHRDL